MAEIMVERAIEQIGQAGRELEAIVGTDVVLTPKEPEFDSLQIDVSLTGERLEVDLVVDVEREVIVAKRIRAEASIDARNLLKTCQHVGQQVDCGSLFILPESLPFDAPRDPWERTGFRQNFFLPSESLPREEGMSSLPESEGLLGTEAVVEYHNGLQEAVGEPLEWGVAHAERPYIVSLDVSTSLGAGESAPFHCFLHFHELSGACFIEKVVVPEERRGQGIGTKVFHAIRRLASRSGCRHLYLIAKQDAERFWTKQGFQPIQRFNYRMLQRRQSALRKVPGWEVGRVGVNKLRDPVWQYRNHPQDDLDLVAGLEHLSLS